MSSISLRHLGSSRRTIFCLLCVAITSLYVLFGFESPIPFLPEGHSLSLGSGLGLGLGKKPIIPFEIDKSIWADLDPDPDPSATAITVNFSFPDALPPQRWGMKVPNVVHYIMLSGPEGRDMDYRQYLAIRSALVVQKPQAIYLHYDTLPSGIWWETLSLEPSLILNHVEAPTTIWGEPLDLPAHRSDIIRLYALRELGGVYLDLDVFVLKPLDDLFYEPFTMGLEDLEMVKMGNAVIISAPEAAFIERWIEGYKDFQPWIYEYNGVIKPLQIAKTHPEDMRLLNVTAFFYPHWWLNDLVFRSTEFDWGGHDGYTYHAWGSLHNHLKDLNPEKVLGVDTSFHRLVRQYMGDRDLEIWRDSL